MRKIRLVLGMASCLAAAVSSHSAVFEETFAQEPVSRGWKVFGEQSLFRWDGTNGKLEVTWDSSQSNSYFYHSLGTVLAKDDDFGFSFDLVLRDVAIGTTPGKSETFELAVGLVNLRNAQTNFVRGTQTNPLNLVEFDYFPDSGWGATISPTLVDSNHNWANYAWIFQELTLHDLFHIEMNYTASNQTFAINVTRNGQPYGASSTNLGTAFLDFRVDAFSISSYSDAGQDPTWDGSILAHGTIDNVVIISPAPLVMPLAAQSTNGVWEVQFASRTNWVYHLEATSDMRNWSSIASGVGNGGMLALQETNAQAARFYRVLAERP